jgi:hypothetical protein
MYAVYDAHTAEKVIDILDGGPARQVSDLDKHVVCLCYYINQNWDVTAFISYSTGSAGDEDYDAITLALGFNYKIRR